MKVVLVSNQRYQNSDDDDGCVTRIRRSIRQNLIVLGQNKITFKSKIISSKVISSSLNKRQHVNKIDNNSMDSCYHLC